MIRKYFLLTAAILFLFTLKLNAQNGNVVGVVKDALSGHPLPGANVFFVGTSIGTATELEGNFSIKNVSPGTYLVRAKYIGYKDVEDSVTVFPGISSFVEFELSPDVFETELITISAQAQGQVAAINQQLNSNTIINVISEEKIQELPDANAAEAIGRLPGVALQRQGGEANQVVLRGLSPKFSSITIDGVRIAATDADERGVDLSMISQGSLAGIELYKALTPDKEGDAIAGSVNLVTKKAPSQRIIKIDANGGFNKLENSYDQYNFTLKYGERFFDDILGVQVNGNLEQRVRSDETHSVGLRGNVLGVFNDWSIGRSNLIYTDELRKRNGFSLLLDINTPDEGSIKINNTFSKTDRNYTEYRKSYPIFNEGTEVRSEIRNVENEIESFNSSITGDNHFGGFDFNWGLSLNQSVSEDPYDFEMLFREPDGMPAVGVQYARGPVEDVIALAYNDFNSTFLEEANYREKRNIQKERASFLNISREYSFTNMFSGTLKFGGKYKSVDRARNSSLKIAPYYNGEFPKYIVLPDGSTRLKDFTGTSFDNLIFASAGRISLLNFLDKSITSRGLLDNSRLNLNPLINVDLVKEWYDLNRNGSLTENPTTLRQYEYWVDGTEVVNYYDLTESIGAGYIMNTLNVGNLGTFIAGVRVENESNTYKSRYGRSPISGTSFEPKDIVDTTFTYNEVVWLQNYQLLLKPTDFYNLRLAAYQALARPDYNARLIRYRGTRGNINQVYLANPNLKAARAWNFEISNSFYGNEIGLITISGYYKIIKNMYHRITDAGSGGLPIYSSREGDKILEELQDDYGFDWPIEFPNYYIGSFPYNSLKDTKVWGFEFEHQINFLFLPGFVKNFVLSYNISVNRSETYILQSQNIILQEKPRKITKDTLVQAKSRLEDQPELFGNVALGYDIGGFSARLSVNFQSEYTRSFSADGKSDVVQDAFSRWDLSLKQKITDNISVLLNVINLTDFIEGRSTKYSYDAYSANPQNLFYTYGLTADLGVSVNL